MLKIEVISAAVLMVLLAGMSWFGLHELHAAQDATAAQAVAEAQTKANQEMYNSVVKTANTEDEENVERIMFGEAGQSAVAQSRATGDGPLAPVLGGAYGRVFLREQARAKSPATH